MHDFLPSIDIAVVGPKRQALRALSESAKQTGLFSDEVQEDCEGEEGFNIANLRFLGKSQHDHLGAQLISLNDQKNRLAVEIRAARWKPDDPPTFASYCRTAQELFTLILKKHNAKHHTRYRLRIPTKKSLEPKLPPAAVILFNRFTKLANTSVLHPLDWERFYAFVWKSRSRPLNDEDMARLLIKNGFTSRYAKDIASIYGHLCEFKSFR